MLSHLRNLETVMMMPNTLCLFEQLYPIQLCQIHQRGKHIILCLCCFEGPLVGP